MVIESAASQLFKELSKEHHLRGLNARRFSERAGYYLGEINVLHPFREGNGRCQREFITQLAQTCDHSIEWTGISQEQMVRASIAAYNSDAKQLSGLILAALTG